MENHGCYHPAAPHKERPVSDLNGSALGGDIVFWWCLGSMPLQGALTDIVCLWCYDGPPVAANSPIGLSCEEEVSQMLWFFLCSRLILALQYRPACWSPMPTDEEESFTTQAHDRSMPQALSGAFRVSGPKWGRKWSKHGFWPHRKMGAEWPEKSF